jgi:hypothetical protein
MPNFEKSESSIAPLRFFKKARTGQMKQLLIEVASSDEDAALLEQLTQGLRSEIEELEVGLVEILPARPAPRGSKAGPGFEWGQLLVTLAGSGSILIDVVKAIDGWLRAQGGRSVTVEIDGDRLELTGVSSEAQRAVIRHWIERHRG